MGNRDDDRNFRNAARNDAGPDRSGPPRRGGPWIERDGRAAPPPPDRGAPGRAFDHYVHGPNESPYDSGSASRDGDDHEGSFLREDRFGHTPGQRWSGGYGGDRDRYEASSSGGPASGRGFTGSDFGGLPRHRDRQFGAPADMTTRDYSRGYDRSFLQERDRDHERHFGTFVDRGGRMDLGYGPYGTDMGMGSPDHEAARGPHYGKGPKGYKRSDERTHDDVCDAIAHFGHVDASDVEVKVEDGIVTLTGTVAHRRDKRALEHVIERCRGVHDIHNELRVKRVDAETKLTSPRDAETPSDVNNGNHKNGNSTRS